jgi:RNA polymerase sigma-70 factor, ECF subfamily
MLQEHAVAAFLARLEEPFRSNVRAEAASELARAWEAARAAWPDVALDAERFCAFVGERAARAGALASLESRDLYLACACLDGDRAALLALDALLDEVGRKLRRLARSDDVLDEAKQLVRQVVVPRRDRPAPLDDYAGRGALGGWLRIALGRELVRLGKQGAREPRADTAELAAAVDDHDDPETTYLKTHYQHEFKEAFALAMAELEPAERRALRYSIVERLSIDDIARLDGVHRATAARQLTRARDRLTEETRRMLRERLQIGAEQLQSILRLIESQVDVSVRRLLAG